MERPDFSEIKDFDEFCKYYWYREELIKICKELGLKASGSKIELMVKRERWKIKPIRGKLIRENL